jgi:hypothetical protein
MGVTIAPSTARLTRSWFARSIVEFQNTPDDQVLADLVRGSPFPILQSQRDAWLAQFVLLRRALVGHTGMMYLEFSVPRMGHRIDTVVLVDGIVLAIEFKVDATEYLRSDIDQAYDYAIDLKYFHEASHNLSVVPILVASRARARPFIFAPHARVSGLYQTVCTNAEDLTSTINRLLSQLPADCVDPAIWEASRYCPTPTIVEAARALYAGHGVADISRSDAGAINLRDTSNQLVRIIEKSKSLGEKAVCFVTGVPYFGTLQSLSSYATQEASFPRLPYLDGLPPFVWRLGSAGAVTGRSLGEGASRAAPPSPFKSPAGCGSPSRYLLH